METYLKLISKSFQRSIAYKLEYYTSLANAFLYIFIFTSVWKTVAREHPESLGGWSEETLIQYAILSTLIKVSYGRNESLLTTKIKSGDIAYDLLKPYHLTLMYISDSIGVSLFQFMARALPLMIFSFFFFGTMPSIGIITFVKFLLCYCMSYYIYLCFGFALSCLAFFFTEVFSFMILYSALVTLLSGSVIPLNIFPESVQRIVSYTPFPYLYFYPTAILVNTSIQMPFSELLFIYLVQCGVMSILAYTIYFFGIKKVEFAGG
jgi:ABC-2 type transport system permease protein